MIETFQTDGLKVTRDEATELCIHHLRLAAIFFECGAKELSPWLEELRRQCPLDDLQYSAMRKFLEEIFDSYEEAARRD